MAKKTPAIKKVTYPAAVLKTVEELKVKHNLTVINVVSCDGKYCYLKTPDRAIYKMAIAMSDDKIDEAEIILENCWLAGDEAFKTDDELFINNISQFLNLIAYKESELKKL